jgi:DNA-binding NtrC family response regulator
MMPTPKTATDAILVVCPSSHSSSALSGILQRAPIPVTVLHSQDCEQAVTRLAAARVAVVICETSLPDGTWKDLLEYLHRVNASSVLVVTSEVADESLWAEVLNLGGYDVLAQPFDSEEVTRVVRSAVMASSRELQRRPA